MRIVSSSEYRTLVSVMCWDTNDWSTSRSSNPPDLFFRHAHHGVPDALRVAGADGFDGFQVGAHIESAVVAVVRTRLVPARITHHP